VQSLYLQVADDLDQKIEQGEYPPGMPLPSYRELQDRYGVASGTIREAVDVLQARGRVVKRPRMGVIVRGPEPRQRLVVSATVYRNDLGYLFSDPAGHWVPIGSPTRGEVGCPEEVADALGVPVGEQVLMRHRLVGISAREPMQLTTTYLHPTLPEQLPVVAEQDTGPGGWIDRLEEHPELGGPMRAISAYYTRWPTGQEAAALWMPVTLPVLVEVRRLFPAVADVDVDPPVAVDLVVRDGARWEIRTELARDESATWPVPPAASRNTP
jgi:GntR family transcriptional regulator